MAWKNAAYAAVDWSLASAKLRSGGPIDDEEDYALPVWAGHVPLAVVAGSPVADARLAPATPIPPSLARIVGARSRQPG